MSKLKVVAQNAMDLFYKEYKSDEEFWELYHFQYLVVIGYAAVLQREYEKSYAKSLQETGIGTSGLNAEWFVHQQVDVKKTEDFNADYELELPCPAFSFNYDRQNSGIKAIISLNTKCKDFIRIDYDELYKMSLLPPSPEVYFFPQGKKIYFVRTTCGLSKVVVVYIPTLDPTNGEQMLPLAMEDEILKSVLNLFIQAKAGNPVVDVSQDANPNATIQTEINNLFNKYRKQ